MGAELARAYGSGGEIGAEELGDSEIQELGLSLGGHEDVGRFHVAVDHQVLVGDLNRGANLAKELQPFRYRQLLLVAVLVDRLSLDVLHDQEQPSVLGRAAVVELGDVWMVDRGQDLPLVAEPADEVGARRGAPEELDGHGSPELVVLPLGQIDRPHPPMGNLPNQPIGTDEHPFVRVDRLVGVERKPSRRPRVEKPAGFGLILEEALHFRSKLPVVSTG